MQQSIITTYLDSDLRSLICDCINESFTTLKPSFSKEDSPQKEILTRKEAANLLSISLPTLDAYTKQGFITASRIGMTVRYKREDVVNALKRIDVGANNQKK